MRYPIQSLTTKSAAFTGTPIAADNTIVQNGAMWTVFLHITSLSPNSTVRYSFEDSNNGFTSFAASKTFSFSGSFGPTSDTVVSFNSRDYPTVLLGSPNTSIRLSLTAISPGSSVTYESWLATAGV